MPDSNPERVRWDDRAALEELERVHGAIDEWRTRRKQAQAAFEEFVQGFRKPAREREIGSASFNTTGPPVPEAAAGLAPAPDTSPDSLIAAPLANTNAASDAEPLVTGAQAPVHAESLASSNVDVPAPWRVRPDQRRTPPAYLAAIAGGVAAIITAVLLIQSWRAKPTELTATRTDAAVAPPAAVSSQPVAPEGPRTEIMALRRVWVRVTVDGTREVERELNANERIPLGAGRTIVIRAGNAGAIRLTINGEDRGTLGPEGEVMTRTVKTPPSNR